MKNTFLFWSLTFYVIAISLSSCQQASDTSKTQTTVIKQEQDKPRDHNDALFISHESIAKGVTKQIWKEIVFGDYNAKDLKMFDLGKQTSKIGDKDPFQIVTYGLSLKDDPEIFRVSLRSDLKGSNLVYLLNEEQYYTCTEKSYDPNLFSIEMKTAVSRLVADGFLKRKILELDR